MGEYFFGDSYKIVIYFEEVLCIWVRKIKKTKTIITIQIIKTTIMKDKIIITNNKLKRQLSIFLIVSLFYLCAEIFNFVNVHLSYLVPNILSPASPNPGTIYPLSFNFSSMHAV